jgi:hypothetical protein
MDDARNKFLRGAAQTMCASSPSTSAFLAAQRQSTREIPEKEFCLICGAVNMKTWQIKSRKTRRAQKNKNSKEKRSRHDARFATRSCNTCGRVSKQSLEHQPRLTKQTRVDSLQKLPERRVERVPSESTTVSQTKLSSKKRAKARKDREGLQALLNRSKSEHSSRLTLTDLMKL